MLKNIILVSSLSLSLVACGGGSGGKSATNGPAATCEQVIEADQVMDMNNCENIFDLLINKNYSSVNLETAELCYKNAKIIQSAAGKTCNDPRSGESTELISAAEFAKMMKPVDQGIAALRTYYGVSASQASSSIQTTSGSKCKQAQAVYNDFDRQNCNNLEDGIDLASLQTKAQQVRAYNLLKPCIATIERLESFAGLSCADFDVPEQAEFNELLPIMRNSMQQLEAIINSQP